MGEKALCEDFLMSPTGGGVASLELLISSYRVQLPGINPCLEFVLVYATIQLFTNSKSSDYFHSVVSHNDFKARSETTMRNQSLLY